MDLKKARSLKSGTKLKTSTGVEVVTTPEGDPYPFRLLNGKIFRYFPTETFTEVKKAAAKKPAKKKPVAKKPAAKKTVAKKKTTKKK